LKEESKMFKALNELVKRYGLERKPWELTDKLTVYANLSVYSKDMVYRYVHAVQWDEAKPFVLWICLNPTKRDQAGEIGKRTTLRRMLAWSKRWGYGGILIGDVYALRANDPRKLRTADDDPTGPLNDEILLELARLADRIVAAWGNRGRARSARLARLLQGRPLWCLGLTKYAEPKHPRSAGITGILQPWTAPENAPEKGKT
jgi:hypothetical protein